MLAFMRRAFALKWKSTENTVKRKRENYLSLVFLGILEDILFWKRSWLSVSFILCFNVLFFVGSYQETKFPVILIYMVIVAVCADGLELWLKHKHRTSSLQQLANRDNNQLDAVVGFVNKWLKLQWNNYTRLRDTNHTKAFLMVNIFLTVIFIIGKCFGAFAVAYLIFMLIATLHLTAPVVYRLGKKLQNIAESDGELDNLIPEISDRDLHLLSVEPDYPKDDKQSLDYWKPEDELPGEDVSDSSENSSSLATNLSMEKLQPLDKGTETSDSSDDEYIPLVQQKEKLQSTLEIEPASSWSSSAVNALYNLTGAVANMVYTTEHQRQPVTRADSSDGFEFIDRNDL